MAKEIAVVIKGMYGLGDNIYQRAFVREIKGDVYLRTTWPQIYKDLPNVHPVFGHTRLRTQQKNVAAQDGLIWHKAPAMVNKRIQYHAGAYSLTNTSVMIAMAYCFGVKAKIFDLPNFDKPLSNIPYAVVRPASIRAEWKNTARSPRSEYICKAADILRDSGLKVISVADLVGGVEWADHLPVCDEAYNHGELKLEQLLGLIQGASVVVGGVGWIVPASIACNVPLITILGGQGGHNAPEKVTGVPMDLNKTRWIYPDTYCRCTKMNHACKKTITNFEQKFKKELDSLCLEQLLIQA